MKKRYALAAAVLAVGTVLAAPPAFAVDNVVQVYNHASSLTTVGTRNGTGAWVYIAPGEARLDDSDQFSIPAGYKGVSQWGGVYAAGIHTFVATAKGKFEIRTYRA